MMDAPAIFLERARACVRRGDTASALREYVRASDAPQTLLAAVREGARLAIAHGAMATAAQLLDRGMRAHPAAADLHALVAVLQRACGRAREAVAAAEQALRLDAGEPTAAAVVADVALTHGAPSRALAATDAGLAKYPRAGVLWRDRGRALLDRGEPAAASAALRQSFALNPADPATRSNLCLASLYDSGLDALAVQALHVQVANAAQPNAAPQPIAGAPAMASAPESRTRATPLRVGVLSADLRMHPVGVFMGALFAHADPERVEWFVYANHTGSDAVTTRLRARTRHWRDIATLGDIACLEALRADRLDVLLDLSGHTAGARPEVIQARVAPMQIAYLGYPAPTAARGIDAMIADVAVVPEGAEQGWPERILRLPHAFLCYEPYPDTPDVASRAHGARFTFGSFNNLAKLDDATVGLWCRVLEAAPETRLLLCATSLAEAATIAFTRSRFAAHGIGPARLECAPPVANPAQLLARYAEVDIALDPLRFNGGTTTLDALWQGVPVITLPGAIMPSRMAASALATARLEEWIARDADDYVAIAVRAAAGHRQLAQLRATLRDRLTTTTLIDGARFAASFVGLLEQAVHDGRRTAAHHSPRKDA
ncbi:MAG: hypothetical protein ABIP49_09135 [Lysobacterales bacterium]